MHTGRNADRRSRETWRRTAVTPSDGGAVALQCQAVVFIGTDGDYPGQAGWHNALSYAKVIASPSHDTSIIFQGQVMIVTRRDRHDAVQARGDSALAILVIDPGHHRAIGLHGGVMSASGGNAGGVENAKRNVIQGGLV